MEKFKDEYFREKLLKILSIIVILITFFLAILSLPNKYIAVAMLILLFIEYILRPLNDNIIEKGLIDKNASIKLILWSLIFLVFAISLYIILFTNNYNLNYIYYIAGGFFYIILIDIALTGIIKDYNNMKKKGKDVNQGFIVVRTFLFILLAGYMGYLLISDNILPIREITIGEVALPESIQVSEEIDNTLKNKVKDFLDVWMFNNIHIESTEDIEKIVNGIETKEIKSLTGVDRLNYLREKSDSKELYRVQFIYDDSYSYDNGLERGFISSIDITADGTIAIEQLYVLSGKFLGPNFEFAYYPISLSEEAMEIINSYIKKLD